MPDLFTKKIEIVDFKKVIKKLRVRGWSIRGISRRTGVAINTVIRLRDIDGYIPKEFVSERIMALYESGEMSL